MISSYKQLTVRYLKANKKRSLLTVIGIILSIALISSIGFFLVGMQQAEIDSVKNDYGSWQVSFSKPSDDLISKVVSNPKVSKSGLYQQSEEMNLGEGLKLSPIVASDKALELLPFKIKEGRFPQNKDEVALEKWVLSRIDKNIKIGEKIKLANREYTLVGILQDNVVTQTQKSGTMLSKSNNIDSTKAVLLAEISTKTNLKKAVKELGSLTDKKILKTNSKGEKVLVPSVINNSILIDMQGGGDGKSGWLQFYAAVGIIIGIVVIATSAVIYNSFQISVVERIKQFGLLRAIGMTAKQIRKIVIREATILSVIGIPLGIVLGIIAISIIGFVFKAIGGDSVVFMKLSISPTVILISLLIGLVSIYVSALIPAFFAGKISPLVAINSRTSITKEKIKKRRNFIIGRLFKFEGMLASKNIKRNRKRYRITVFSIVISVVLFITFKSFMDMTLNISKNINESKNVHFLVQTDSSASGEKNFVDNKVINNISKLDSVDTLYKVYNVYNFLEIVDREKVTEGGKIYGVNKTIDGKEKVLMTGSINVYDNAALRVSKKYIQSGSIDVNKLNSEKKISGASADVHENPNKSNGETRKVKVMAILKADPFDFNGIQSGPKLITTEEMAKKLTGINDIEATGLNISIKNIKNEESAKAQIEGVMKSYPSLSLINYLDSNRTEKSTVLMVKILVYGFVVVVSLIGSVNIINTLTTNIILRKKEFAALKAIGLTQKSLRKMIVLEGLLYGIVGTLYGSIIACGLSFMMYKGISGIRETVWPVPWSAIIIAAVFSILIGYLSVLAPLARINKENLIEAVREDY
ncbi:ABC transporter permease [Clostridium sp.]|uniref:ABC transporter permease n=1 Tax=Clostridium sp. TaxID=1506 RepID=UPI00258AB3D5|nr:ABC transporter permease [Clostridium sp.]MDF2505932.1 transporter ATP-binding protein [Clostridium sp.]